VTPEWKLFINFCPNSAFHPRFTCHGRIWRKSAVAKLPKSCLVLPTKKDTRPGHFLAPISLTFRLAYCTKNSAYNNNNSDDRVAQHLDYVQHTWLDSTMWPRSLGMVGVQTASANEQRRRGFARASQQQSQPWSAKHVSAAVPSPRGSRPRKHWCLSAVRCGHLSVAAEKVYTSPQPPVHAVGRVRCGPLLCEPPPHCLLACREAHVNSYL